MSDSNLWFWLLFAGLVLGLISIDLGFFHRRPHAVSLREAALWSGVWIFLALAFNLALYIWKGTEPALEFLTGYLIEKSLSLDNIFVFAVIFSYFRVDAAHQHRVLFWGILGALVTRALFIVAGISLIHHVHAIIYVFGIVLIVSAVKLAFEGNKEVHPENNLWLRLLRRLLPVTPGFRGAKFFVREGGRLMATPLFMVLVVVESTDVVFAVDSIPAILAITDDLFIVYTSNVFAILGLRALYFVLASLLPRYRHLHYGLAAILAFVGVKMFVSELYPISTAWALGVIAAILTASVVTSNLFPAGRNEG